MVFKFRNFMVVTLCKHVSVCIWSLALLWREDKTHTQKCSTLILLCCGEIRMSTVLSVWLADLVVIWILMTWGLITLIRNEINLYVSRPLALWSQESEIKQSTTVWNIRMLSCCAHTTTCSKNVCRTRQETLSLCHRPTMMLFQNYVYECRNTARCCTSVYTSTNFDESDVPQFSKILSKPGFYEILEPCENRGFTTFWIF